MAKTQTSAYVACQIPPPEPPGPRIAIILHTELETPFLEGLTQALEGAGYAPQVVPLIDLNEFTCRAITMAERLKSARLLILDDQIAGRSAFEYLLNLRAYEETKNTPLCLLSSGDGDTFARNAWLAAGVDRLVSKTNQSQIARFASPLRVLRKDGWRMVTETGRQVITLAQQEAIRWQETHVSTEHLLLALMRHDLAPEQPIAIRILEERFALKPERIRQEIERQLQPGEGRDENQDMQLTQGSQRIFDMASDEAWLLEDRTIGTEHLLLGMLRDGAGLAGRVLSSLGVDLETTRRSVLACRTV